MKKRFLLCLVTMLLLGAVVFTGCAKSQDTASESAKSAEEASQDKPKIGLVFDSFVIERWERDRDIFSATARKQGADVIVGNANGDVNEQINIINHMIDQGCDVLVIVAVDCQALDDCVERAHKAGIKVISYDRIIQNSNSDLYISFDNEAVGRYMAQTMNDSLPQGGSYIKVNGPETDYNVTLVNTGFDERIGSGFHLIGETNCKDWNDREAYEYLTENADLLEDTDAIMCGNDSVAGQVIRVLAEKQMAGKVVVTGQDADLEACQRVIEGTQTMTVYKPIEELASKAAEISVKMANGSDTALADAQVINDGTYDIPYISIQPIKVTDSNMDTVIINSGFHMKEDVYLYN